MSAPPSPHARDDPGTLPQPGDATSPLWRIWLPISVASVASGVMLAAGNRDDARTGDEPVLRLAQANGMADVETVPAVPPHLVSTVGGGAVAFDANGDGHPDLYHLGGGAWPWDEPTGRGRSVAGTLLINTGAGSFADQTISSGLTPTFPGMAAAAGDFDLDGDPDLAVSGVGGLILYSNNGYGIFTAVPVSAAPAGDDHVWRAGVTWVDANADGWPDLVTMTYARWPDEVSLEEAIDVVSGGRSYGTPTGFLPDFPQVLLNQRDGTFLSAEDHVGLEPIDPLTRSPRPWGLAALPLDANGDSLVDLLLTFAEGSPQLFLARPGGGFRRAQPGSEVRREGDGFWMPRVIPGGDPRSETLLRWAQAMQAGQPTLPAPRGGPNAVDLDWDGQLEAILLGSKLEAHPSRDLPLEALSGHLSFARERSESWLPVPLQLSNSASVEKPAVSRAAVTLDFDLDGDEDIAVTQLGAAPRLLRNEPRITLPWVAVQLDVPHSSRSADGSRVEVVTPRGAWAQTWLPRHDGLGQSVGPLRFGLAADSRVSRIVVRWNDGEVTTLPTPALNRLHRIVRQR
ncbi:MAG: CRTAC1 family protein [Opitutaceae bacterium]|nr:CRTAC1 family protein [Opitutaceae bacterium]